MLDNLKDYFLKVAVQKYVPMALMSGMAALGGLFMAHEGLLESWGINYIPQWSASWLATHPISGPILLIELDTTNTAILAAFMAVVALIGRAGEHHTIGTYVQAIETAAEPPKGA